MVSIDKLRSIRGLLYHSKHNGVYRFSEYSNSRGVITVNRLWNGFRKQHKTCSWCGRSIDDGTRARYWHPLCHQQYSAALGITVYSNTNKPLVDLPDWDVPCCSVCQITRGEAQKKASDIRNTVHADSRSIYDSELSYGMKNILLKQNWNKISEADKTDRFELDHKIAISIARTYGRKQHLKSVMPDNLQWLCYYCHRTKTKQDRTKLARIAARNKSNQKSLWEYSDEI